MLPSDLNRVQRGWLVAVAVLVHALIAWVALTWSVKQTPPVEQPAIEVALISNEPTVSPVVPTPPTPVQPQKAAVVTPPTPAVRTPQPVAPPILASAKPAQANEMQAPPPVPVAETKPAAQAAPTAPPVASPASPNAQVAEAVRPPAQPVVLPSSALRYLFEPPHNYPRASIELGESGVVKLRVLVDEQGRPTSVTMAESSGFPRLDQEAVRFMKAARFQPRIVDGVARSVSTIAPVNFNLEEQ